MTEPKKGNRQVAESGKEAGTRVRLDLFDPTVGLDRGRSRFVEAAWYLTKMIFFLPAIPWPSRLRVALLRAFGAKVGKGVLIRQRTNIHMPWKLEVGDHCWIGEEVWIVNLEPVRIGSHCCISQRAFLCTGSHDYQTADFRYRNAPITVEDGAWVGAQAFVGPGVVVGRETVLGAGSVASRDLGAGLIYAGVPASRIRPRWQRQLSPPEEARHER